MKANAARRGAVRTMKEHTMAREFLKDMFGRKIGSLEDQPKNQVAYDQNGAKVGRYEKNNNTTYDRDSKKVGTGNLLAGLFGKKK